MRERRSEGPRGEVKEQWKSKAGTDGRTEQGAERRGGGRREAGEGGSKSKNAKGRERGIGREGGSDS